MMNVLLCWSSAERYVVLEVLALDEDGITPSTVTAQIDVNAPVPYFAVSTAVLYTIRHRFGIAQCHRTRKPVSVEFGICVDIQPSLVNELKRFTKPVFDLEAMLTAASDLKYTKEIKQTHDGAAGIACRRSRAILSLCWVYTGVKTAAVVQQFTDIVRRALNQFMNEAINQRLQSAIAKGSNAEQPIEIDELDLDELTEEEIGSRIVTTEEELEGYFIVKSIVREVAHPDRILHRDTVDYMSVVLDNSRQKPICRLYFNRPVKYLSLPNEQRKYERVKLDHIDDIHNHAERLKATVLRYDAPVSPENEENEREKSHV